MARAPIDIIVGGRLAGLRTARGLSQDQLAAVLGVSAYEIADYEAGAIRISSAHLVQISRFFQVPLEALFPDTDPGPDVPAPSC